MAEKKSIYEISVTTIDGKDITLDAYKGKIVMIVNVASKCGFTKQYEQLQEIYEKYEKKGFVILGFPSNDFAGQEPGKDSEIKSFCQLNFGVSFPMFSKISVKGKDQHPLYKFLTGDKEHGGKISWNFNKFLIGKDGSIINRFGTRTKPDSKKVIQAIEKALATK